MRAIVFLGGCMLLLSQFQVTDGLYGGIDTSNYFALLLGTMVAIVCLVKAPKTLYRGDAMVFVLFVYLLIHASLTHAMQSREFYLSISYFALYAVFRVHIPVDTRSAFPVISVQSPVSIQYRWQS